MKAFGGLRAVVSFLTIIPAGYADIEDIARHSYFFPIVGGFVGLVSGLVGLLAFGYLPEQLAGWLVLGAVGAVTGLTHFDSLLDLGDGLMLRGAPERRLKVLHDKCHGVGGIFLLVFALVLTQSLIVSSRGAILTSLVAAEALSKFSMVFMGCIGKPGPGGIGALFISELGKRKWGYAIASAAISLVLCVPFFPISGAAAFVAVAVLTVALRHQFIKVFGCINGDMMGACGEFARMLSLFIISYGVLL